uniref:Uncharacterized protein n=1 Tax=Zea mays TaxID=4577 RepID=C4J582_MAIZE|nr:unknown [Zea mays]
MPMVTLSWNRMLSPPRILVGAISDRNRGTAWLAKPTPQPSKILPTMSMARFWAAPLKITPTMKKTPATSMVRRRPRRRVVYEAKKVAVSPARYSDDVNSCSGWLSYLQ